MMVILMAGCGGPIFNHGFLLFRYCLGDGICILSGFAWMRPDYVIAKYNVEHGTGIDMFVLMIFPAFSGCGPGGFRDRGCRSEKLSSQSLCQAV